MMKRRDKTSVRKKPLRDWKALRDGMITIGYILLLTAAHWYCMYIYRYESMFYIYVWLVVYIFFNLLAHHIAWKRRLKKKRKAPKNIITKILHFIFLPIKHDFTCLKTSLYLFFALVLVASQVTSLASDIHISDTMEDLLEAIQYGFAPLIAFDQVFAQFRTDKELVEEAGDALD